MPIVTFSNLYLLSQRERRALRVPFDRQTTLIRAENGMGKSAIVKSLYETFGAIPHQVDQPWRGAGISAAVEFAVGGERFTMVRGAANYGIFDAKGQRSLRTGRVETVLARVLADLFDFRLVMADREGNTVIPPPAYIFAPFYVDQDVGWTRPWKSFDGMTLPKSPTTLAEYHSGLKPNEYYLALAERDRLRSTYQDFLKERQALDRTFTNFRETIGVTPIHYNLDDFVEETVALLDESDALRADQEAYRVSLSKLTEERTAWKNQNAMLASALNEMGTSFELAIAAPHDVECPMCGARYENSVTERFGIIENEDGIIHAMLHADARLQQIEEEMQAMSSRLRTAGQKTERIDAILRRRRGEITFDDVVTARSHDQTSRTFRQRLEGLTEEANRARELMESQEMLMRRATSARRAREIRSFFADRIEEFGIELDVRPSERAALRMTGRIMGRGSAHPRAFLTFFYAFLHTARRFSSAAFCPIVIDAPNQQGQDDHHMERIMHFIVHRRPPGTQVIVAAEKLHGLTEDEAAIVNVENEKHGVLREDAYEEVSAFMRPFLGNLI